MTLYPMRIFVAMLKVGAIAALVAGVTVAAAEASKVPRLAKARITPGEIQGFNPQPDPPDIQRCKSLDYYNAHVASCEPIVLKTFPPGPCKGEGYLNRHFHSCLTLLPTAK